MATHSTRGTGRHLARQTLCPHRVLHLSEGPGHRPDSARARGTRGGGVEVRLVIDAIGSAGFPKKRFETLERAGGASAGTTRCAGIPGMRANNRTHREITIVDGTVGSPAARALPTSGCIRWIRIRSGATRWSAWRAKRQPVWMARLRRTGWRPRVRCWPRRNTSRPLRARRHQCARRHQFAHGRPVHRGAGAAPGAVRQGGHVRFTSRTPTSCRTRAFARSW